jgi:DUF1009 family protein
MTAAKIETTQRLADHAGRVAIVAGNGLLPINVAEALVAAGNVPFLVRCAGKPIRCSIRMSIKKFRS